MKCPICHVTLMPAHRGPVAIDFCPSCWGVWLDRGELDAIVRQARQADAGADPTPRRPVGAAVDHPADRSR